MKCSHYLAILFPTLHGDIHWCCYSFRAYIFAVRKASCSNHCLKVSGSFKSMNLQNSKMVSFSAAVKLSCNVTQESVYGRVFTLAVSVSVFLLQNHLLAFYADYVARLRDAVDGILVTGPPPPDDVLADESSTSASALLGEPVEEQPPLPTTAELKKALVAARMSRYGAT